MKLSEMFDRKYLTRVVVTVAVIVIAVCVLFSVGYHLRETFSSELELVDARMTTVSETISADAYIMRSEKPITVASAASGSVVPEVHDGNHVSAGTLIAEIYSKSSPEIETRLDEIDEQISLYEKNKEEDRSLRSTAGVDQSIYDTLSAIRRSSESGNYADAISLRTSLLVDIKKRAILTGEITDYDAQISRLNAEKSSLTASLGTGYQSVYAGEAGYYFAEADGYGKVFNAALVDTMTYSDFMDMASSDQPEDTSSYAGIMVSDFEWYIACHLSKNEAGVLDTLGECDVTFSYSGVTIHMDVWRVIPEIPGENAVVIFRSGFMPTGFDYTRVQPVEICARQYTGFKIPKAALRVLDGYQGVYIMDEVTIRFKRVHIIYEVDGNIICTGDPEEDITITREDATPSGDEKTEYGWIAQNDVVVVGGTELHTGKVIG